VPQLVLVASATQPKVLEQADLSIRGEGQPQLPQAEAVGLTVHARPPLSQATFASAVSCVPVGQVHVPQDVRPGLVLAVHCLPAQADCATWSVGQHVPQLVLVASATQPVGLLQADLSTRGKGQPQLPQAEAVGLTVHARPLLSQAALPDDVSWVLAGQAQVPQDARPGLRLGAHCLPLQADCATSLAGQHVPQDVYVASWIHWLAQELCSTLPEGHSHLPQPVSWLSGVHSLVVGQALFTMRGPGHPQLPHSLAPGTEVHCLPAAWQLACPRELSWEPAGQSHLPHANTASLFLVNTRGAAHAYKESLPDAHSQLPQPGASVLASHSLPKAAHAKLAASVACCVPLGHVQLPQAVAVLSAVQMRPAQADFTTRLPVQPQVPQAARSMLARNCRAPAAH
jgi:hypothetical protein